MRAWLRQLRNERGMTQQNVADELGITQQYYSSIENGERQKDIDCSLLSKLSAVFGIPISQIVEEESKLKGE